MPLAPYARILVSLNGGPPQQGGVQASFGDLVVLAAESTIGWGVPAAVWEITSYPAAWPPPQGWSVDPVTKAYTLTGNLSTLPAFPLPDANTGLWGKWKFRLRVNGGGGALTDWSTAVEIVSPHGVRDLASGEGGEFGAERGWPGPQQQNLRLLEQAVAGAGSTLASIGVTPPLKSSGSPTAPILGIALATPTTDGAMPHQDKAKLDGATPAAQPSALVARDGTGTSAFNAVVASSGFLVPAQGALGVLQLQAAGGPGAPGVIRAQQGAPGQSGGALTLGGGDAGTPGLANTWAGSTLVQLGSLDAATQKSAALQLLAGASGAFLSVVCMGGAAVLTVSKGLTIALGGTSLALTPTGLALAVPSLQIANTQAPPANPTSGIALYAEAGAWKARSANGVVATAAPAGTVGGTSKILDWLSANLQTQTNVAQPILSYPVPPNAVLELEVRLQARNPNGGHSSWFRRVIRVRRATGAPVLKATLTPIPDDDESLSLAVFAAINGSNVEVRVQGQTNVTIQWFASARVELYVP